MHTKTTPTPSNWSPSRGEAAIFLLLIVAIVSDMPEPVPFWQSSWGQAPSVGTALLIAGILVALVHFTDRRDEGRDRLPGDAA